MGTLVPQGFSRSLPSFSICGYLPYSRQNARNLPEIIHRDIHRNSASRMERQTSFGPIRNGLQVSQEVGYKPPLKLIVWPVIKPFRARITATQATSSGRPNRRTGIQLGKSARRMSVSTIAGEITFAVIPTPASCDPYECVCPIISAFDAA
jgi:hypothetical protein